ncbi:MAG: D-alanyl-D-alanine carboxypeptidase [Proteobacteria bacterium]|nr:D-alanyl-D-alanine carboxypeptidase [Pseudomonadota bacterium]
MTVRQRFGQAIAVAGLGFILLGSGNARAIESAAREALLIDFETGAVLFDKNADVLMPPASMSKIMTAYLAFERIKEGRLALDDEIPISEKAWRKGGSKMFVELNSRVKVSDVLRGIVIQSGNDAAIAMAEALAGSEAAFAEEMTNKAHELGMASSEFRNATGWPDPQHRMTARDLATLATATIRNFPEFYPIYSETTFTYNKIKQGNRNPLLYKGIGADGLKTGHTEAAGYGLTASVERGERRLVLVINGLKSVRERTSESQSLIEWGFREFDNYDLLKAGETVETLDVWLGNAKTVPLVLEKDLRLTLPRSTRKKIKLTVVAEEPVPAPIIKGQRIATLKVAGPGIETRELPMLAAADVAQLGTFNRVLAAVTYLLWGAGG